MDQECHDDVCVTCSDEGRPGAVIAVPLADWAPALLRTERGEEYADVTLVGPVELGDRLIVHAGVAIAKVEASAG